MLLIMGYLFPRSLVPPSTKWAFFAQEVLFLCQLNRPLPKRSCSSFHHVPPSLVGGDMSSIMGLCPGGHVPPFITSRHLLLAVTCLQPWASFFSVKASSLFAFFLTARSLLTELGYQWLSSCAGIFGLRSRLEGLVTWHHMSSILSQSTSLLVCRFVLVQW